jgi:hypothetical protein
MIKGLIKTVSKIYEVNNLYTGPYLNPETLFKSNGDERNIETKYPILIMIEELFSYFHDCIDDPKLIEFKCNKKIREDISNHNMKVDKSKLNNSTTNLLKKGALVPLGLNTPSPLNIKTTPLVGTSFQHQSNNSIFNFCTD